MPEGYNPNKNKERLRAYSGGAAPNRSSQADIETAGYVADQRAQDPPEPVVLTAEQEALFSFNPKDPQWEGMRFEQIHAAISEATGVPYPGAPASRYPDWDPKVGPTPKASKPKARKRTAPVAREDSDPQDYDTLTMGGVTFWLVPEDEYVVPDSMVVGGVTYFLVPQ